VVWCSPVCHARHVVCDLGGCSGVTCGMFRTVLWHVPHSTTLVCTQQPALFLACQRWSLRVRPHTCMCMAFGSAAEPVECASWCNSSGPSCAALQSSKGNRISASIINGMFPEASVITQHVGITHAVMHHNAIQRSQNDGRSATRSYTIAPSTHSLDLEQAACLYT
jgi:hypothetical protein